jgi:hypothetical protein
VQNSTEGRRLLKILLISNDDYSISSGSRGTSWLKSTPVFLVTNDYDLGQEAQQNRAVIIPLEQFGHYFRE